MAKIGDIVTEQAAGVNPPVKKQSSGHTPAGRYVPPERQLSCSIRRKYGAIEIEFGVIAPFAAENEADQQRLWNLLQKQVSDMHDDWALNELPNVKNLTQSSKTQVFPAAILAWKTVEGERQFRIKTPTGTPFAKFGATIYPETINKCGMNIYEIVADQGTINLPGWKVEINTDAGAKVTRLWKE